MLKTAKAKIISLVLIGGVVLGGAAYAGTALAAGGASAAATAAPASQPATGSQLRSSILDMLRDRMGLTGQNAEHFADQMIARMQNANAGFDFQTMVDWCGQLIKADSRGTGPSNGPGPASGGWGMMNRSSSVGDATTPSAGYRGPSGTEPAGSGAQNGGSGFTPGGMMGGSGLR